MNKQTLYRLTALTLGALGFATAGTASAQITYESQLATTTALGTAIAGDVMQTVVVGIGLVIGIAVFSAGVLFIWRMIRRRTGFGKQM